MRLITVFFLFFSSSAWSQKITGKVIDGATQKPLAKASVFISSTSIGTATNENGEFTIDKFPSDQFDMVVSFIGYETLVTRIIMPESNFLTIGLKPKEDLLESVVVTGYENGWKRWGAFFTRTFLGTTPLADFCTIKNPEDIRFSYSKNDGILKASAIRPIIVINKGLGYKIEYNLQNFYFNTNTNILIYTGFPLFTQLEGGKSKQMRWEKYRQQTYEGSLLQFMRAVNHNNIEQTGFEIRRITRIPDEEKERVKRMYEYYSKQNIKLPRDTMSYFSEILYYSNSHDTLYPQPVTYDNIAKAIDSNDVAVSFKGYLYITYPKKKPSPEYYFRNKNVPVYKCITAKIILNGADSIIVTNSGSFYDPSKLVITDYWSWSERMSTLLPFDYKPSESLSMKDK